MAEMEIVGRRRVRLAVAALLVVLAAVAVVVFLLRPKPIPAPSTDGEPVGNISGPDVAGKRTYESKVMNFRLRYPNDWRVSESGYQQAEEGDYLTLTFAPPKGKDLKAPSLEVVPDPQGFAVEDVARMRWGNIPARIMTTTSTIDVGGVPGMEARMIDSSRGRPTHTYEALTIVGGRLFVLHLDSSDTSEFEQASAEANELMRSIEPY